MEVRPPTHMHSTIPITIITITTTTAMFLTYPFFRRCIEFTTDAEVVHVSDCAVVVDVHIHNGLSDDGARGLLTGYAAV